jgi:hypothetical protein
MSYLDAFAVFFGQMGDYGNALLDSLDDVILVRGEKRAGRGSNRASHALACVIVHHCGVDHHRLSLHPQTNVKFGSVNLHNNSSLYQSRLIPAIDELCIGYIAAL